MVKSVLLASFSVMLLAQPAQAEEGKFRRFLHGAGHYAKKTLVCPVYIVGGAVVGTVTGGVVWYHVGGHEGDLHRAFTGN